MQAGAGLTFDYLSLPVFHPGAGLFFRIRMAGASDQFPPAMYKSIAELILHNDPSIEGFEGGGQGREMGFSAGRVRLSMMIALSDLF